MFKGVNVHPPLSDYSEDNVEAIQTKKKTVIISAIVTLILLFSMGYLFFANKKRNSSIEKTHSWKNLTKIAIKEHYVEPQTELSIEKTSQLINKVKPKPNFTGNRSTSEKSQSLSFSMGSKFGRSK